jgi:hypothetical protein
MTDRYALHVNVAFWEIIFRKATASSNFQLSHENDFDFLNVDTYEKRVKEATTLRALVTLPHGFFSLGDMPSGAVWFPKPNSFIDKGWPCYLLQFSGTARALWVINFLLLNRWTEIGQSSFQALADSLKKKPFEFTMQHLKHGMEKARRSVGDVAEVEAPMQVAQRLESLHILIPLFESSFYHTRRNEKISFYLNLSIFACNPDEIKIGPETDPWNAELVALAAFAQILIRRRNIIRFTSNPAKIPVWIEYEYWSQMVQKHLQKTNQRLHPGIDVTNLLQRLLQHLQDCEFIELGAQNTMFLKSERISDWDLMKNICRETCDRLSHDVEFRRIEESLEPFRKYRNPHLAELVCSIARSHFLQRSRCVSLYIYLQSKAIKREEYEDFRSCCENDIYGDLNYPSLLWHDYREKYPSPGRAHVLLNARRSIRLSNRRRRSVNLTRQPPPETKKVEVQITLRYDSALPRELEGTQLKIWVTGRDKKKVFEKMIALINISPEKAESFPPAETAWRASTSLEQYSLHVSVSHAVPQLTVGVVLRFIAG